VATPTTITNPCIPYHETGDVTVRAEVALVGKRFVKISDPKTGGPGLSTDDANVFVCSPCGAGEQAVGVAAYNIAITAEGPVLGTPGKIVPVTSGAAITAGVEVMSDANGKAIAWTFAASDANKVLGVAMGSASGADVDVAIKLRGC
jgi:hypothetical protein